MSELLAMVLCHLCLRSLRMFSSTAGSVLPLPLLHGVWRPRECANWPEQEVVMVSARHCLPC